MKTGLIVIIALVIGTIAAQLLLTDNGYVLINFRGYVVEMSVTVLAFLLVLAYLLVRGLVQVWLAPRRLGQAWTRLRIRYAGRQATKGYIALAEGRLARGERLLTRGARLSDTPLLNYLAAARAAQMQGDRNRRDGWLRMAAEQVPAAAHAVLLTQAELQLEDGQYDEALASLQRVREQYPDHPQALKMLGELHFRRAAWQPLAELLPLIRRRGNVPADMLDAWTTDAYRHIMQAPGLDRARLDAAWHELPRQLRSEPRIVEARARALITAGAADDAEPEIRRALRERWDAGLVNIYGELPVADTAAQLKHIESWLADHSEDPVLLLAAGRACIRHQLWGKARSYLETSIAIRPAPESYHALGQLMVRVGEGQSASRAFEKGLSMSSPAAAPRAVLPVVKKDGSRLVG